MVINLSVKIDSDLSFNSYDPTVHDAILVEAGKSTDMMILQQRNEIISMTEAQAAQLHYHLSKALGYMTSDHEGMSYYEY